MLLYQIALTMVPGIGDVLGKKLLGFCSDPQEIFTGRSALLRKVPRIGPALIQALDDKQIFIKAEKELEFIRKNNITPVFYTDAAYPARLKHCIDSPLMLYFRGTCDLNQARILGIVGTRKATSYGKELCRQLLHGIREYKPLIVSGLAYGIDSAAHRFSLENELETVGVLGHGLDRIYPYHHTGLAERMTRQGGLLTDFPAGTSPDRENFPKRNRLIAGLCDGIIVVEAAQRGGALITAEIANSYNRDVFAFPGRVGDIYSEGTNMLIKQNKAALVASAEDIIYLLGWETRNKPPASPQRKIFLEMTPEEERLVNYLSEHGKTGIDELSISTGLSMSKTSSSLLNLEFEGIVRSLPGKVYLLT